MKVIAVYKVDIESIGNRGTYGGFTTSRPEVSHEIAIEKYLHAHDDDQASLYLWHRRWYCL